MTAGEHTKVERDEATGRVVAWEILLGDMKLSVRPEDPTAENHPSTEGRLRVKLAHVSGVPMMVVHLSQADASELVWALVSILTEK